MATSRRRGRLGHWGAALAGLAASALAPAASPQASSTAETFKAGGPIPYTTYLKRTGQSGPAKAKPKKSAAKAVAASPQHPPSVGAPAPPPPAPVQPAVSAAATPAPKPSPPAPAPPKAALPQPPESAAPPPPAGPRLPEAAPVPAIVPPSAGRLAPGAGLPPAELEAFVDGAVRQALGADHVAGAAVVVVQDGQVLLEKGYGLAHEAPARPVDPRGTLFRLGSVSKVITWIGVLKAIDEGRLKLDAPVDDALPADLKLGLEGFKEPVRLRHLMNHTAGFEARELGRLFKADPRRLLGLEGALKRSRSRRVREAGRLTSYSNYGVALAGEAGAASAKAPFDSWIEGQVLRPAGLASTSFREPYSADGDLPAPLDGDLADRVSQGFRWTRAGLAAQPFEFGQDFAPALSASATPADMGRLMQLLLGAPAPWSPRVTAALFTPLPGPVAGLPGWTHGLQEQALPGGFAGFGQGGATLWFRSRLLLAPQLKLGVFVAANTNTGQRLVEQLPAALVARFYGPPALPASAPWPAIDADRYAGLYLTTRRAYHGLEALVNRITRAERVSVGEGGRLVLSERGAIRTFAPSGADRFTSPDGAQTLVFLSDPARSGGRARLFADAARSEAAVREGWVHEPVTLVAAALLTAFTGLLCLTGIVMRRFSDRRETRAQALAAGVQNVTALAWLFAIGAGAAFLRGAHDPAVAMYRWPNGWLVAASWAALAAALLTMVQMVQLRDVLAETRRRDSWTAGRRVRHIVSVLIFTAFGVLVAAWGGLEPWSS